MRDRPTRTAVVFTVLALGFSLLYWLAVVLSRNGTLPFSRAYSDFARKSLRGTIIWLLFANFGPALAGIIALALCRGAPAVEDLGRSIVQWRVPGRLYVFALAAAVGRRASRSLRPMEKVRPLPAAAIVGVIWYAWHVPLYAAEARMNTAFEHTFFFYTCVVSP